MMDETQVRQELNRMWRVLAEECWGDVEITFSDRETCVAKAWGVGTGNQAIEFEGVGDDVFGAVRDLHRRWVEHHARVNSNG